jgi:hypothetical protein
MSEKPIQESSKESATKVDARDGNASASGKPQPPMQNQGPAKKVPGAFGETGDTSEPSDPPLRKGLHESIPRDSDTQ